MAKQPKTARNQDDLVQLRASAVEAAIKLKEVSEQFNRARMQLPRAGSFRTIVGDVAHFYRRVEAGARSLSEPLWAEELEAMRQASSHLNASVRDLMRNVDAPISPPGMTSQDFKYLRQVARWTEEFGKAATAIQLRNALPDAHRTPAAQPHKTRQRARVPKQEAAPVMTDIVENTLVAVPGPPVYMDASAREVSAYLAKQLKTILSDLENSNTAPRVIEDFAEMQNMLRDWSTSKLLAFGSHLYVLEGHTSDIREEKADAVIRRVEGWMHNSRQFLNSFDERHAYTGKSIKLAARTEGIARPVREIVTDAASTLADRGTAVQPGIPTQLAEIGTIMTSANKQAQSVGLLSALRSMKNISISISKRLIEGPTKALNDARHDPRAAELMRMICAFLPMAIRLAALRPDFAFIRDRAEDIRAICDGLKTAKVV